MESLSKDLMQKLVIEVSFAFEKYMGKEYFDTQEKRIKHLYGFTKVLLALIENKLNEIEMQIIADKLFELNINEETLKKACEIMKKLLISFCKKYNIDLNEEVLEKFSKTVLEKYHNDDLFFEIDNEEVDEAINGMHYNEDTKINAKDFLKTTPIDEDIIEELRDILEEYYVMEFDELNEEYVEKFKNIIQKFISIFNYSFEFKDLAYGLENLLKILNENILISQNKELIKVLLDSIIKDLEKFYYSVFVNKDAIDIHYLDASLIANVSQIEILLK